MRDLIVADTSVFIDFLRGTSDDNLSVLVLNNQVLLSRIVRLELLAGVRKKEITLLDKLLNSLRKIDSMPSAEECEKILLRAKGCGLLAGLADIMILADVLSHKATLFTNDKQLIKLAKKLRINVI